MGIGTDALAGAAGKDVVPDAGAGNAAEVDDDVLAVAADVDPDAELDPAGPEGAAVCPNVGSVELVGTPVPCATDADCFASIPPCSVAAGGGRKGGGGGGGGRAASTAMSV